MWYYNFIKIKYKFEGISDAEISGKSSLAAGENVNTPE